MYLPKRFSVLRVPLEGTGQAGGARVLFKPRADSWATASVSEAPIEKDQAGAYCRFAASSGSWSVAIVVPGSAPALMSSLEVRTDATLAPVRLAPAGRVKARLRGGRSGELLAKWTAHIRDVSGGPVDTESAAFWSERPLDGAGAQLDDASVPVGAFELLVDSPDLASRRLLVAPVKAGEVKDLGDVFLSAKGSLRVTASFPSGIPEGALVVRASIPAPSGTRGRPTPVAERRVQPAPVAVADLGALDPGLVLLSFETSPSEGLWRSEEVSIHAGELADVAVAFSPISVSGDVVRGSSPCRGAKVLLYRQPGQRAETSTDEMGHYAMRVWSAGKYGLRVTPAGQGAASNADLLIPDDATEISRDFDLPDLALAGRAVDAEGRAVVGATVWLQTSMGPDGSPRPGSQSDKGTTDADGAFSFRGLSAAPVDLDFRAKGFAPKLVRALVPAAESTVHEVVLARGRSLRGRITDINRQPVVGAMVWLSRNALVPDPDQQATSGSSGEFSFEAVDGSNLLLIVRACGLAVDVRLLDSGTDQESVDVVLQPATRPVTVRFVDDRDRPTKVGEVSFELNGLRLPQSSTAAFVGRCGGVGTSAEFALDYLPFGAVRAYARDGSPLGALRNDGTGPTWTMRVTRSTPGVLPSENPAKISITETR